MIDYSSFKFHIFTLCGLVFVFKLKLPPSPAVLDQPKKAQRNLYISLPVMSFQCQALAVDVMKYSVSGRSRSSPESLDSENNMFFFFISMELRG